MNKLEQSTWNMSQERFEELCEKLFEISENEEKIKDLNLQFEEEQV